MSRFEELEEFITRCIHAETPVFEASGSYISVATTTWCPDVYSLAVIEDLGFTFHGEIQGIFIFKIS